MNFIYIYEPVTKGCDLKWDTLPQNQTPSKLFSVLPLESGMFQVTISMASKLGSGQVWTFVTMDTVNVIIIQRKTICMQF